MSLTSNTLTALGMVQDTLFEVSLFICEINSKAKVLASKIGAEGFSPKW